MIVVRSVTENDTAALRHLRRERLVILSQTDARFRRYLDEDMPATMTYLVAEDEGAVVGYVAITQADEIGVIADMALDAHTYHSGAGRALVMTGRDVLLEQDAREIVALVPRYHPVEQAFWLALGATEWTKSVWEIPPEMVWMRWTSVQP